MKVPKALLSATSILTNLFFNINGTVVSPLTNIRATVKKLFNKIRRQSRLAGGDIM